MRYLPLDQTPRRAFLFMPLALGGLVFAFHRKQRPVPDPLVNGSGPPIPLVVFSDNGKKRETVEVAKFEKTDADWQRELSPEEFAVTRKKGTERAFTGRYWDNHEPGLYLCVCCGTPLFRSEEKFDSGTGWPSFWAPAAPENVATARDNSLFMERVEVHCPKCGAHLGHLFDDGPPPTNQRYCINSVALRFVPE